MASFNVLQQPTLLSALWSSSSSSSHADPISLRPTASLQALEVRAERFKAEQAARLRIEKAIIAPMDEGAAAVSILTKLIVGKQKGIASSTVDGPPVRKLIDGLRSTALPGRAAKAWQLPQRDESKSTSGEKALSSDSANAVNAAGPPSSSIAGSNASSLSTPSHRPGQHQHHRSGAGTRPATTQWQAAREQASVFQSDTLSALTSVIEKADSRSVLSHKASLAPLQHVVATSAARLQSAHDLSSPVRPGGRAGGIIGGIVPGASSPSIASPPSTTLLKPTFSSFSLKSGQTALTTTAPTRPLPIDAIPDQVVKNVSGVRMTLTQLKQHYVYPFNVPALTAGQMQEQGLLQAAAAATSDAAMHDAAQSSSGHRTAASLAPLSSSSGSGGASHNSSSSPRPATEAVTSLSHHRRSGHSNPSSFSSSSAAVAGVGLGASHDKSFPGHDARLYRVRLAPAQQQQQQHLQPHGNGEEQAGGHDGDGLDHAHGRRSRVGGERSVVSMPVLASGSDPAGHLDGSRDADGGATHTLMSIPIHASASVTEARIRQLRRDAIVVAADDNPPGFDRPDTVGGGGGRIDRARGSISPSTGTRAGSPRTGSFRRRSMEGSPSVVFGGGGEGGKSVAQYSSVSRGGDRVRAGAARLIVNGGASATQQRQPGTMISSVAVRERNLRLSLAADLTAEANAALVRDEDSDDDDEGGAGSQHASVPGAGSSAHPGHHGVEPHPGAAPSPDKYVTVSFGASRAGADRVIAVRYRDAALEVFADPGPPPPLVLAAGQAADVMVDVMTKFPLHALWVGARGPADDADVRKQRQQRSRSRSRHQQRAATDADRSKAPLSPSTVPVSPVVPVWRPPIHDTSTDLDALRLLLASDPVSRLVVGICHMAYWTILRPAYTSTAHHLIDVARAAEAVRQRGKARAARRNSVIQALMQREAVTKAGVDVAGTGGPGLERSASSSSLTSPSAAANKRLVRRLTRRGSGGQGSFIASMGSSTNLLQQQRRKTSSGGGDGGGGGSERDGIGPWAGGDHGQSPLHHHHGRGSSHNSDSRKDDEDEDEDEELMVPEEDGVDSAADARHVRRLSVLLSAVPVPSQPRSPPHKGSPSHRHGHSPPSQQHQHQHAEWHPPPLHVLLGVSESDFASPPPHTDVLMAGVLQEWSLVEAGLRSLGRAAEVRARPILLLCLRATCEAYLRARCPYHFLLEAALGEYGRRYGKKIPLAQAAETVIGHAGAGQPPPSSGFNLEPDEAELKGVIRKPRADGDVGQPSPLSMALLARPPAHLGLDSLVAALLDPSRLASRVPSLESGRGDQVRGSVRRARGELRRVMFASKATSRSAATAARANAASTVVNKAGGSVRAGGAGQDQSRGGQQQPQPQGNGGPAHVTYDPTSSAASLAASYSSVPDAMAVQSGGSLDGGIDGGSSSMLMIQHEAAALRRAREAAARLYQVLGQQAKDGTHGNRDNQGAVDSDDNDDGGGDHREEHGVASPPDNNSHLVPYPPASRDLLYGTSAHVKAMAAMMHAGTSRGDDGGATPAAAGGAADPRTRIFLARDKSAASASPNKPPHRTSTPGRHRRRQQRALPISPIATATTSTSSQQHQQGPNHAYLSRAALTHLTLAKAADRYAAYQGGVHSRERYRVVATLMSEDGVGRRDDDDPASPTTTTSILALTSLDTLLNATWKAHPLYDVTRGSGSGGTRFSGGGGMGGFAPVAGPDESPYGPYLSTVTGEYVPQPEPTTTATVTGKAHGAAAGTPMSSSSGGSRGGGGSGSSDGGGANPHRRRLLLPPGVGGPLALMHSIDAETEEQIAMDALGYHGHTIASTMADAGGGGGHTDGGGHHAYAHDG